MARLTSCCQMGRASRSSCATAPISSPPPAPRTQPAPVPSPPQLRTSMVMASETSSHPRSRGTLSLCCSGVELSEPRAPRRRYTLPMRSLLPALALVTAALSAQSGRSDGVIGANDSRFEKARATIERVVTDEKLPGVSIAVAQDGAIVWQEAFGWANKEKQIRATPATAYSLASISKPITATGVMRLVEQKKVDLDKPANDYLGKGKL